MLSQGYKGGVPSSALTQFGRCTPLIEDLSLEATLRIYIVLSSEIVLILTLQDD